MTKSSGYARWLALLGASTFALTLAVTPPVYAQTDEDEDETDELFEDENVKEEIVVTGSRLRRDTYSSISPLQVISADLQREVGLIDPADILQESGAATGQQIDLTLNGFVVPNGPGSSNINLRNLGSARTLVLLNGRRLAPSGVEGAPFAADLNLIPGALVQQYDILLDGASSIYGSDAVAGVTNVILRKDFEGLELEVFNNTPDQSSGVSNVLSATWGKNTDRGFFGVGIEYEDSEAVTIGDRSWTSGCYTPIEVDENGRIRNEEIYYETVLNMDWRDGCDVGLLAGRVSVPASGSIYYTPGSTNGGWGDFSESSLFGLGVDGDGDGRTDISFLDYSLNGNDQNTHLFPEFERTSVMAFGEYTFDGDMNLTPFFEVQYNQREVFIDGGPSQLFPTVPANNPFNICNPNGVRGVDCGDAFDALLTNPNFEAQVAAAFGLTPTQFRDLGIVDLFSGPLGPQAVTPIVSVQGDRSTNTADVDQTRYVVGVRGDLPFINWGDVAGWGFEIAASHTESTGTSNRLGVRGDRLALSLATTIEDPNNPGTFICGADNDNDGIPDGTDGCVPIDMFAPSLYPENVVGDFATEAERAYLFDSRDFDTEYEQQIITGYVTGNLFNLPAGGVAVGLGIEYREDEIRSIPDEVARDGLLQSFFADGGATGEKYTREYFGEIEVPILAGQTLARELNLNLSARNTKDEFYGSAWTGSAKLGYRPVDSLLLRATYGTSFRAPNLRENFLQSQTGFANVFDPCFIPEAAIDPLTGGYNAQLDTRDPDVLANCLANGADPTTLNNNGFNTYSVEIARGGQTGLVEETSDSFSAGFAWDQPFSNDYQLTIGATYYKIDIEDTIVSPAAQFIVSDCYSEQANRNSAFCSKITRDANGFINLVDAQFINRDEEIAEGVDVNVAFETTVTMFERPVDLQLDVALNHSLESSETFINADGTTDFDDDQGEFGVPDWQGTVGLRADVGDFRLTWNTRFIGAVEEDADSIDDFSNVIDLDDGGTCLGPDLGDVNCRDVAFADDYFLHSASVYYYGDVWTLGFGIRNVFDEAPPLVSNDKNFFAFNAIGNVPVGYGYDLNGRTYFVNISANFTGLQ